MNNLLRGKNSAGFTLVELLIVIALLGAIALIVIAAINPLEQANRARDTRFKADGAQLIAAIDRYFTGKNEFPWKTSGAVTSNEAAFGFVSAANPNVGLCGDAGCTTDGNLITALELKTEFRSRDFIKTANTDDKRLFVGKASGASASEYACFIPQARSTRDKAVTDGKVYTISATGGTRSVTTACNSGYGGNTGAAADWATNGCYVCIPE